MNKMILPLTAVALVVTACGKHEPPVRQQSAQVPAGYALTIEAKLFRGTFDANGTAGPISEATLSTKLMGSVEAVYVKEGDRVTAGQALVRIDARDLTAKAAQARAGIAQAEAMEREATAHATRIRGLYAQDAAPKAQLEAADEGLARARAGVESAHAAARELAAVTEYSMLRAPSDGVVTRRLVDPGAFAAPGSPMLTIQNVRALRIRVSATPEIARTVRAGMQVQVLIENVAALATVEGVVPAAGNLYTVNAIIDNRAGRFLPGSAATVKLPLQDKTAITVPIAAVVREGDLTGVYVKSGTGFDLRWIRIGAEAHGEYEVLSGLKAGDQILVTHTVAGAQ